MSPMSFTDIQQSYRPREQMRGAGRRAIASYCANNLRRLGIDSHFQVPSNREAPHSGQGFFFLNLLLGEGGPQSGGWGIKIGKPRLRLYSPIPNWGRVGSQKGVAGWGSLSSDKAGLEPARTFSKPKGIFSFDQSRKIVHSGLEQG